MDNEMRNRLIDFMVEKRIEIERDKAFIQVSKLIDGGAIFPKFKIGQEVWFVCPYTALESHRIYEIRIDSKIQYRACGICGYIKENELYATKADAMASLPKGWEPQNG